MYGWTTSTGPDPGSVGKGLENRLGQNNCFLNVGIQGLWHLLPFTSRFARCERHHHKQHCVFCALKVILTNYEFSEEAVLPPQVMRETLDALYRAEGKFKLGEIEDAAETLEAILENLHECIASDQGKEKNDHDTVSCEPPCVAHQAFGIEVSEQICCSRCKEVSEPFVSSSWIYYVYTSAIREARYRSPSSTFDDLLHKIAAADRRPCTNERCKEASPVQKFLLREPDIFTLDLVWDSDAPSPDTIGEVLAAINTTIHLNKIFNGGASSRPYRLKGLICYYGKHYDAYFYNPKRKRWVVFDDATVKEVGKSFEDVIRKCKLGHFQPSILFFEGDQQDEASSEPTLEQAPLIDLDFTAYQKTPPLTSDTMKGKRTLSNETIAEYKDIKRRLKNCLSETAGLLEMSSKSALQVDLEVLFITAGSLLDNTNTLIDALERWCQRHASWTDYSSEALHRWESHIAELKQQRSAFAERSKLYQAAIHTAQKHKINLKANQMMEAEVMDSSLAKLRAILTDITADIRNECKGATPTQTTPSLLDSAVYPSSPSLASAAQTYPHLHALLSPSSLFPSTQRHFQPTAPLTPPDAQPISFLPSSIPIHDRAYAQARYPVSAPTATPSPRFRWNRYRNDWSLLEDLSDFLKPN